MNFAKSLGVLLVGVLVLGGCNVSVNSPIIVPDGESRSGSLTSVNGDLSIGEDCTIEGTSRSVNGSVKVGDRSAVEDLNAVNGSIRIGEGVSVQEWIRWTQLYFLTYREGLLLHQVVKIGCFGKDQVGRVKWF